MADKQQHMIRAKGKLVEVSPEGRMVAEMRDAAEEMRRLFTEGLIDAGENFQGSREQENTTREGGMKMQIREIGNSGKFYVQADRQVLNGTDPKTWGKQIANYINETIRKEQDVAIPTADGHVLLLTGRSAYKLSDQHVASIEKKIRNLLPDDAYALKGRAATHIDELIQVARFDNGTPDLNNKHENDIGEDGFNYYEAYFQDFDGKYYRVVFSAGINANEETVYSIGQIRERRFPAGRGSSSNEALKNGRKPSSDAIIYTSEGKSQVKNAIMQAYEKALEKKNSEAKEKFSLRDQDVRRLFTEGLQDAAENFTGSEGQKNTTREGGVKMQARSNGSFSNAEIHVIQSIGRKSINSFTTADIKATEKFAQRYWQEMGTKSPFFRAWFGDWRVKDQTPIQIANQKGDTRGVLKNLDTGWNIQVSGKVFNETRNHTDSYNKAARPYMPYINDIVSKAILIDSNGLDVEKAKSENSLLMHNMYAVADIGKGPEILKLYVEEMNDPNSGDTKKRAYQLQNVEKYQPAGKSSQNTASSISPAADTIRNVADLFDYVKTKDVQFNPNPTGKVVNSDGTPMVVYHQTGNEFTVFDPMHNGAGSSDQQTPFGIFLKTSDKDIGVKGKKQMALYANIRNPLRALNRGDLTQKLKQLSTDYATLCEDYDQMNLEFQKKQEAAGKNLNEYVSQWRKENPAASRRDIYEDETFNKLSDAEDEVIDLWEQKDQELSTKAKTAITKALRNAGYDGVFLSDDTGSWGRKTDAIIALDPEQVKSATDNVGTFDKSNPDIRYSIRETTDGRKAAVVEDDILSNIDTSHWNRETRNAAKKAAVNALKRFREGIVVDGITRKVNKTSIREYTRSKSTEVLSKNQPDIFADKMRASDIMDDVIVASTDWSRDGRLKHPRADNFVDFDHGKTLIQAGDNRYSAEVVVGITSNGDAVFYDVVNMVPVDFEVKRRNPPTATTHKAIGDMLEGSSMGRVAQETEKVKQNFSLRDQDVRKMNDVLEKQNEKLREDVASLKELLKLQKSVTGGKLLNQKSLDDAAGYLMRSSGAKGNKAELSGLLKDVYSYMAGDAAVSWDGIMEKAQPAVDWLSEHVEAKQQLDPYGAEVLKELRGSRISLDESQRAEAEYQFGSVNAFRKQLFGTVTITDKDAGETYKGNGALEAAVQETSMESGKQKKLYVNSRGGDEAHHKRVKKKP